MGSTTFFSVEQISPFFGAWLFSLISAILKIDTSFLKSFFSILSKLISGYKELQV